MNSLWLSNNNFFKNHYFNSLEEDLSTDVCIIGAGIFGTTCAYYLTKLGYKVILLEKDKMGLKTTGNTTRKNY